MGSPSAAGEGRDSRLQGRAGGVGHFDHLGFAAEVGVLARRIKGERVRALALQVKQNAGQHLGYIRCQDGALAQHHDVGLVDIGHGGEDVSEINLQARLADVLLNPGRQDLGYEVCLI